MLSIFFILNSLLATTRDITIIVLAVLFILVLLAGALLGVILYLRASSVIKRAQNVVKRAEDTVNAGEQISKSMRFATYAFTRFLRFEDRFRSGKKRGDRKKKNEEEPEEPSDK